jgi:Transposase DDE domain
VRAADTVPKASRGFDAAKKVNGRKRHLAVDTLGLLLAIVVTAASVQDATAPGGCCGGCALAVAAPSTCGVDGCGEPPGARLPPLDRMRRVCTAS